LQGVLLQVPGLQAHVAFDVLGGVAEHLPGLVVAQVGPLGEHVLDGPDEGDLLRFREQLGDVDDDSQRRNPPWPLPQPVQEAVDFPEDSVQLLFERLVQVDAQRVREVFHVMPPVRSV